jgi:hypothetical protein
MMQFLVFFIAEQYARFICTLQRYIPSPSIFKTFLREAVYPAVDIPLICAAPMKFISIRS